MSSIFGWSLPPGCGSLPGEEDDGLRDCPKCGGEAFYIEAEITATEIPYLCEECGHRWIVPNDSGPEAPDLELEDAP